MSENVLGFVDDSGGDLIFGEVVDVLVGLLLSDVGDSLVLVELVAVLVDFFDEFLISFDEIREAMAVDSYDGYHEWSFFILIKFILFIYESSEEN